MTLEEIKAAVLAGETVHWKTTAYRVVTDGAQWLIWCQTTNYYTSLTWRDGVTMSEKPSDFFIAR